MRATIPLALFALIVFFPIIQANALSVGSLTTYTTQGQADKIGIQLSEQCITALRNHVKTGCPTYKDMVSVDNTNHGYYGKFVNDSNGFYHRDKPTTPNYYNIVKPKGWVVALDPTQQFIDYAKMIIIVPNGTLNNYVNPDETVGTNHTRTVYHDRFVDSTCSEARIVYSKFLLNDTISYLESGCTNTKFKDHTIEKTGNQAVTLNNPYSSLHLEAYLQSMMHGHSFFTFNSTHPGGLGPPDCIRHTCNFKSPYEKW